MSSAMMHSAIPEAMTYTPLKVITSLRMCIDTFQGAIAYRYFVCYAAIAFVFFPLSLASTSRCFAKGLNFCASKACLLYV
ncbi:hypothetical protein IQ243_22830 [Nostocales cyanobacterium LEGE 11386]|nr:hypothetical protein [Nostocales cyanobacterium LEGE 11386]